MKAKVFISCGQYKGSDEPTIASEIARIIQENHGFDCYIAVAEQTLLGLRENIFARLEQSDYLIFIDFKREQLQGPTPLYRGSLFSHQELGIASFLGIPALVLQEEGVKKLDGMLSVMQANATGFSDRGTLPSLVSGLVLDKVRHGEWDNQSRNVLTLERTPGFVDTTTHGFHLRYFHISVINHHHRKAALNAFAYLDSVVNLDNGNTDRPEVIELKWAGTPLPDVRIGPKTSRKLDAFFISQGGPLRPTFNVLADSSAYWLNLMAPGRYQLSYSIVSQNFPTATQDFILDFAADLETVKFSEAKR